jgi:hypothetical protein
MNKRDRVRLRRHRLGRRRLVGGAGAVALGALLVGLVFSAAKPDAAAAAPIPVLAPPSTAGRSTGSAAPQKNNSPFMSTPTCRFTSTDSSAPCQRGWASCRR